MTIVNNAQNRTHMMFTRDSLFAWLGFVLLVLAALSGGKIILTSDFDWLLAGGAASFVLSTLVV